MSDYQKNVTFRPCAIFGTLAFLGRAKTPAVLVLMFLQKLLHCLTTLSYEHDYKEHFRVFSSFFFCLFFNTALTFEDKI